MSDRLRPFDSGTQYGAWRERNCARCQKYNPERYDGGCEIDLALGLAYVGDGTVDAEMLARMGYTERVPGLWTWPCTELTPKRKEA